MSGTGSTIGEPSTGPEAHSPEEQNDNEGWDQQIFENLTVEDTLDIIGEFKQCTTGRCSVFFEASEKRNTCRTCRNALKRSRNKLGRKVARVCEFCEHVFRDECDKIKHQGKRICVKKRKTIAEEIILQEIFAQVLNSNPSLDDEFPLFNTPELPLELRSHQLLIPPCSRCRGPTDDTDFKTCTRCRKQKREARRRKAVMQKEKVC